MKILVTGGAGFIGSAVCRHLVGDLGHEVVNLDKLTYAACLASLDPIADDPRYRFEQADICDRPALDRILAATAPDAVMHLAAESHVDRSITGAADFIADQYRRHLPAARGGPRLLGRAARGAARAPSASSTSRPTRSTARSGPTGAVHRDDALRSVLALFGVEGCLGPSRDRLAAHLRPAGDRLELLEQLRALPVPGEAHPADDPQRAGGAASSRSMATARTSATGCYVEDHARALLSDPDPGPARREVQCRRPQRAYQPRGRRGDLRRARPARAGRPPSSRADPLRHRPARA